MAFTVWSQPVKQTWWCGGGSIFHVKALGEGMSVHSEQTLQNK